MSLFTHPNQVKTLSTETLSLEALSAIGMAEDAELKALAMDIDKLQTNINIIKNKKSNAFESYAALSTAVECASYYSEVDGDLEGLESALEGMIGNFFGGLKKRLGTFKRALGRAVGGLESYHAPLEVAISDLEKVTDYDQDRVKKKWGKTKLSKGLPVTKLGKHYAKVSSMYVQSSKTAKLKSEEILKGSNYCQISPVSKAIHKNIGRIGPMPSTEVLDITVGENYSDLVINRYKLKKTAKNSAPTAKELLKFAKTFQSSFNRETDKIMMAGYEDDFFRLYKVIGVVEDTYAKNKKDEKAIKFRDDFAALLNGVIQMQWFWVGSTSSIVNGLVGATKLYTK